MQPEKKLFLIVKKNEMSSNLFEIRLDVFPLKLKSFNTLISKFIE